MEKQLKICKVGNSRGIFLTKWLSANEIVQDKTFDTLQADYQANQIVLTLPPPPPSALQTTSTSNKLIGKAQEESEERHWTELSQEELEAKYPDYPSRTAKDVALLNRKLEHMIDDFVNLDNRVEALSAAVKTLQVTKKGEYC